MFKKGERVDFKSFDGVLTKKRVAFYIHDEDCDDRHVHGIIFESNLHEVCWFDDVNLEDFYGNAILKPFVIDDVKPGDIVTHSDGNKSYVNENANIGLLLGRCWVKFTHDLKLQGSMGRGSIDRVTRDGEVVFERV